MINQSHLFELYRASTGGKRMYEQIREIPAMPEQRWQVARVREYAFSPGWE